MSYIELSSKKVPLFKHINQKKGTEEKKYRRFEGGLDKKKMTVCSGADLMLKLPKKTINYKPTHDAQLNHSCDMMYLFLHKCNPPLFPLHNGPICLLHKWFVCCRSHKSFSNSIRSNTKYSPVIFMESFSILS